MINIFDQLKFIKHFAKNQKLLKSEYNISNFLPYISHFDDQTIMLNNGMLMKVIKMTGFSFESADDEDLDIRKEMRNQFFRGLTQKFSIYSHIVRYKKRIFSQEEDEQQRYSGIYFADFVDMKIRNKFAAEQHYVNELYMSVLLDTNPGTLKFLERLSLLLQPSKLKNKKNQKKEELKDLTNEFDELVNRIMVSFRDYSPEVLSIYQHSNGNIYSKPLEFLSLLLNQQHTPVQVGEDPIAKSLATQRMTFKKKHIEIETVTDKKYAAMISLKEYGQTTHAGFLDAFLQLPCEMVITQSFAPTNRQVAINKMQLQQNRMVQSSDKAISQVIEITKALDDAMSGKIGFGIHHLSIMCIDRSVKALESSISLAEVELMNTGVYIAREKWNLEPCFWGQFPGNGEYIVRKAVINSKNFSGLSSFHNYPLGKKDNNHWGPALSVLNTTSRTPFYFNFHVRDIGHTAIIGPTGAGKTVLMNFLCCQAMKYKPKMFFFDKDRGAEIFLRALGAKYTVLESRSKSGFNPLQLEDNTDNRTFLSEWFKQMLQVIEKNLTAADMSRISAAIEGNFKLRKADRILRNIVPFLGLNTPGSLANRMEMWVGHGSHAALFDNSIDELDLDQHRVYGFEMAELLKDPVALPVVLNYLFHRINISLNGEPTIIVLDEAWALIDNDVFRSKIKDWLKVLRKLNAMVIFATQSVEDVGKSEISDTLIQQTATQIFLPNLKATSIYRSLFMLSQREFNLIKNTDPSSRYFLIKQNIDAVVAKLDLSGLQNVVSVLSGRADTVRILDEIRSQVGDDPVKWLPIFYERVG